MNLREHISKPKYYTAILLTYNIDPLFFENIILRDLHLSNISEIIVICDKSQKNLLMKYADSLKSLGKKYILETANSIGRFHPKIFIKIGQDIANLSLGSSNLSPGGWGNNLELCSNIDISPDDSEGCKTISNIIREIKGYVNNENVIEIINNVFDKYNWINKSISSNNSDDVVFLTPKSKTLFDKLREKINNKRYDSLTILTGSTDANGSFLEECINSFNIKKFNIYLTPSYSRFTKQGLDKLNAEINIYNVEDKYLHSKLYFFNGVESLTIIGSANCSRAAWLISPDQGGNVESIAFLDLIKKKDLTGIFEFLPKTPSKFNDIKDWGNNINEEADDYLKGKSNNLLSLAYDSTKSIIIASLQNPLELSTELSLNYDNSVYKPLKNENTQKIFEFFVDYISSTKTQFGEIVLINNKEKERYVNWIDDIYQLKYLNKGAGLYTAITRLSKNIESIELDSLRRDIESIKNIIIKGDIIFDDANIFTKSKEVIDNIVDKPKTLTPNDLTVSLNSESSFNIESENIPNKHHNITFFGIERIFFGSENIPRIIGNENDSDIDDEQMNNHKPNEDKDQDFKNIETFVKKTEKIIDKFIEGIGKNVFADKCTALQLSQAISFPLALSYFGFYKQYYNINQIEKWFYNLLNILYYQSYDDGKVHGLLGYIRNKYVKSSRTEIFDNTIGNGVILILLELIACNIYEKTKYFNNISIIFYLNTLMENHLLTNSTELNQFSRLIKQSNFEEMKLELNNKFPLINRKLKEIEKYILDNFIELVNENSSNKTNENDIIYGKKYGWGITKGIHKAKSSSDIYWDVYFPKWGEIKTISLKSLYININYLVEHNKELKKSLNCIFV